VVDKKAPIGLADVIAAIETLDARDGTLVDRIARMLLLDRVPHSEPVMTTPRREPPPHPDLRRETPPEGQPVREEHRPSSITRSQTSAQPFATPIPPLGPATDEEHEAAPPFEPLFRPAWTRAILSTALATPSPNGHVDVARVVERLSRGYAIPRLPRRAVPTLRQGVQLLVDHGNGMVPFRRDAAWLVREIMRVAGEERTSVLRFRGLPSRGVADPRKKIRGAYVPPPRAVPVVLISDLGIGLDDLDADRATAGEWTDFLHDLRRTNDEVLAFVPYPRERCPERIVRLATIIEFDRTTTLSRIRSAVRQGWSNSL
jgi:hypothetical protein